MDEFHLAQLNVARLRAPIDSPELADFVAALEPINAVADRSPGFVWRLQTDDGNATSIRVFDDDMIIVNMSVWESVEDLASFVYRSEHRSVFARRKEWFEQIGDAYLVLWWTPAGGIPTVEEAVRRLELLRAHGPTAEAFTIKTSFPLRRGNVGAMKDRELDELRDRCTKFLHWQGPQRAAALLADIPADTVPDRYGEGGVVAELEGEVATLLGKPAALFLPSGTMAQQATLRVHADRRGRRTVAFHPTCHLDHHEGGAYQRLHGLVGRPVGDPNRLITMEDLRGVAEPLAALLLELPQREIGGLLPPWEEVEEQAAWARERGAAVHLDGARLWECTPYYDRSPAGIAEPFDTVYVSFYKGLAGLAGCCVAGPEDVMAELREWRTRHGGRLFALWPYAASALAALRRRLPLMPRYFEHARAVAAALREIPGVDVVPDPPMTPMMHLFVRTTPEAFTTAAVKLAEEEGVWTWGKSQATRSPNVQKAELVVGDGTLEFTAEEAAAAVARLAQG